MSDKDQKPLNQLTMKDLLRDLFNALTDLEGRFVKTFRDLTTKPDTVVFGYIGSERKTYISPFRYLLLSIFVGFLSYSFFYSPGEIGGSMYTVMRDTAVSSVEGKALKDGVELKLNHENFDLFFKEFSRLLTLLYKLVACMTIPALFLTLLLFYRKLKLTIPSLIVTSTFLNAHASMLTILLTLPFALFLKDNSTFFYLLQIPTFMYLLFSNWKFAIRFSKRPKGLALSATLFASVCFFLFSSAFGLLIVKHAKSKTPNFIETIDSPLNQ